jgi:hypothetical protein
VQPLITALNDSDQFVRESATRALSQIGRPAVDALEQLMDEGTTTFTYYQRLYRTRVEVEVRYYAADALQQMGTSIIDETLFQRAEEVKSQSIIKTYVPRLPTYTPPKPRESTTDYLDKDSGSGCPVRDS